MKKSDIIQKILSGHHHDGEPKNPQGLAFAPTNIALCKYWGKRDVELNLPMTSSLSIAVADRGAMTTLTVNDQPEERIMLNDDPVPADSDFMRRVTTFLDLFRQGKKWHLDINIKMNVPLAAGLASSACGFASLTSALNDLFNWRLSLRELSILARLGSGSAARSLWAGFVEWHAGIQSDGMDSYAEPLDAEWSTLCLGFLIVNDQPKTMSSRAAMQQTVDSSGLYGSWPKKVAQDLSMIKQAIKLRNFSFLGGTAESNALAMHATMLSSWPPICYFQPETIAAMHKIWELRRQGLEVFFTQDAGPNLKLLLLERDAPTIKEHFPTVEIVKLFN